MTSDSRNTMTIRRLGDDVLVLFCPADALTEVPIKQALVDASREGRITGIEVISLLWCAAERGVTLDPPPPERVLQGELRVTFDSQVDCLYVRLVADSRPFRPLRQLQATVSACVDAHDQLCGLRVTVPPQCSILDAAGD